MRFWSGFAARCAVVLVATAPPVCAQTTDDSLKADFNATGKELAPLMNQNSDPLKADAKNRPKAMELLFRESSLTQQWIVNYLNEHQWEGDIDLKPALRRLNPQFSNSELQFLKLDNDTYVVGPAPGYPDLGTPFIAARTSGAFKVATIVSEPGQGWSPEGVLDDTAPNGVVGMGRLPDTTGGDRRFYIETAEWHMAGAIAPFSLQVWTLNAGLASASANFAYESNECTPSPYVKGRYLHIPTVSGFRILFSVASSCQRQLDQVVYIGPDQEFKWSEVSLTPELDLIDSILEKLDHGEAEHELASSQVSSFLKAVIDESRNKEKNRKKDRGLQVELGASSVHSEKGNIVDCASLFFSGDLGEENGDARELQFTMHHTANGLYASEVKSVPFESCDRSSTNPH